MHLRPLHDRIIGQRLEDSRRAGVILIPDSANEKPEVSVDVLAIQERSL